MAYSEEVKKLAETLKNSGLAASMTDALERAQTMIGINEKINGTDKVNGTEVGEERQETKPVDNAQTTLKSEPEIKEIKEVVPEVNEPEMNEEEVFKPAVKEPSKPGKKIDLTEIFNVNK